MTREELMAEIQFQQKRYQDLMFAAQQALGAAQALQLVYDRTPEKINGSQPIPEVDTTLLDTHG